jgi:PTS system nitrogen regulatory IIA component
MPQLPMPSRILCRVTANNRRSIFKLFARHIAADRGLHPVGVSTSILDPATLQSTRLFGGTLMLDGCLDGLDHPYFLMARLAHPVQLNTTDPKPVDLIALFLSPPNTPALHLQRAAAAARFLRDHGFQTIWRAAPTPEYLLHAYQEAVAAQSLPIKHAAA